VGNYGAQAEIALAMKQLALCCPEEDMRPLAGLGGLSACCALSIGYVRFSGGLPAIRTATDVAAGAQHDNDEVLSDRK
jgi:hypothetical protein